MLHFKEAVFTFNFANKFRKDSLCHFILLKIKITVEIVDILKNKCKQVNKKIICIAFKGEFYAITFK